MGEVEGETDAGEIGERTGEIIETLSVGENGRDGCEALKGVSEGNGGDESAEEWGAEGCSVEEGGQDSHCYDGRVVSLDRDWGDKCELLGEERMRVL